MIDQPQFPPMTTKEMEDLGWSEIDVLLVTGDAYVDHPAFGAALLARWLIAHGFRTGIVAQPDWRNVEDISRLGRPKLFVGVTAGALDSMLAHYTAFRKKRSDDSYTPGGKAGARPNRAAMVYANLAKQAFPGLPVVLGGIEASLRRAVHFDFWTDKIRRSILPDAKADLLIYGMGERAILEVARRLADNADASLKGIRGTAFIGTDSDIPDDDKSNEWPGLDDIRNNPKKLVRAALDMEKHVHLADHWAIQENGGQQVVFAPPAEPLATEELDALFALPFTRQPHPKYKQPIPAVEMLSTSINTHRGCGGGCSFCSLALHQGRKIRSRSRKSLLDEVRNLATSKGFKGSISDVGGPSAGMWGATCARADVECHRESCLYPTLCRHFDIDHAENLKLLQDIRGLPQVRHVRVSSGVRFDLALDDTRTAEKLFARFVGGQLKVAPEHVCDPVLKLMRKPGLKQFESFISVFEKASREAGKEQYLVPYLMSAFPGSTDNDMKKLAAWLKERHWKPRQVQCFIPTPGTVATAMYHAEIDTKGNPIHVAKTDAERLRQHGILMPERKTSNGPRGGGSKKQWKQKRK